MEENKKEENNKSWLDGLTIQDYVGRINALREKSGLPIKKALVEELATNNNSAKPDETEEKNINDSFDGLTAKDLVEMFNSEAAKSGMSTRATVKEAPTTTSINSEKTLKDK